MANNYLQFSVEVPISNHDEREWLQKRPQFLSERDGEISTEEECETTEEVMLLTELGDIFASFDYSMGFEYTFQDESVVFYAVPPWRGCLKESVT